jgi:hypothetical protein
MKKRGVKVDYYARKALRPEDEILVGAIDVETDGFNGELLMVQWGIAGEIHTASGSDMLDKLFDFVLQWTKPAVWYSHFAQYDWRYLIPWLIEKGYVLDLGMRTDNDVYEVRITNTDGETVILRDSFALWNSKLEALADTFCPEIPKLKIDIEQFDPENPEHIAYARRDVQILMVGLPRLFDMLSEHFGVNAGATTAGTALKAWQKSLQKDEIYDCSEWGPKEAFIRQAYYGGIVFLTNNVAQTDCITCDINSSYPAVMDECGVPWGRVVETVDWQSGLPGIYRVRVRAPDGLIVPILPARNNRGAMRWYSGEFETVVTNIELLFAAQHGYEILEIYEGVCFEKTIYPFSDLISHCKMLRMVYKDMPVEMLAKLIQNSLYGKFGARRDRVRVMHAKTMEDEDYIGAQPLDDDGEFYIRKEFDEEMRCLPQWSVFITANARLKLLKAAYAVGPENVIYGDTDSITLKKGNEHLIDIGPNYGQFKIEKEWETFRAVGPKQYSGKLGADILKADGSVKVAKGSYLGAAKGLAKKAMKEINWKELLEDGATKATTITIDSLRVCLKKGIRPARTVTRNSSDISNSSNYDALPDGNVRVKSAVN